MQYTLAMEMNRPGWREKKNETITAISKAIEARVMRGVRENEGRWLGS